MTLWEWACAVDGYAQAHASGEEAPPPMEDDRLAELGIEGF